MNVNINHLTLMHVFCFAFSPSYFSDSCYRATQNAFKSLYFFLRQTNRTHVMFSVSDLWHEEGEIEVRRHSKGQ